MDYATFKKWAEEKNVLNGFNLTDKLMQELFSDLDPHKKGHLTINDWETTFKGYSKEDLHLTELQDFISTSFFSAKDAWEFFIKHNYTSELNYIDYNCFKMAVVELLPGRFTEGNINHIWHKLLEAGTSDVISKIRFSRIFEETIFTGSLKLTPAIVNKSYRSRVLTRSQTDCRVGRKNNKTKMEMIEPNLSDIHSKLRRFMKTSSKTLEEVFRRHDEDESGTVTN